MVFTVEGSGLTGILTPVWLPFIGFILPSQEAQMHCARLCSGTLYVPLVESSMYPPLTARLLSEELFEQRSELNTLRQERVAVNAIQMGFQVSVLTASRNW